MANLLDFQTVLWPEVKTSNVGFYRKPYAGFPAGSVIQAPFTRSGAGRKVIDASGNLVDAAANVPAWTFPIGGSSAGCPYLSFLPSVENVLTRSEKLDDADWTKSNVTITADAIASPDGTTNADKVEETAAGSATYRVSQDKSFTSGTTYTISGFLKADEIKWAFLQIGSGAFSGGAVGAYFDLENGIKGSGVNSPDDFDIIPVINGWYYCYLTITATTSGTTAANFYTASSDGGVVHTGVLGDGFHLWGAQLKEGSYISPLDYVKTEASAVTRSVDKITNITDLQTSGYLPTDTEGSVMLNVSRANLPLSGSFGVFNFKDTSDAIQVRFRLTTSVFDLYDDLANAKIVDISENELMRIVFTWSGNELKAYANGFLIYSYTHSSSVSIVKLTDNQSVSNVGIDFKMLNFAPTALTANQAEAASSWPSFDLMVSDLGYS